MTSAVVSLLTCGVATAAAGPISLDLPVDCEIGRSCFVQQYVDIDPGPGIRDWMCGGQTYDGHKGTDIRVRALSDAARGVNVLAAAGGKVIGRRDGMPDRLVRQDDAAVKDRECGNGVRIDHGNGWLTQYCHMRRGSVKVSKGERVRRGAVLGEIGYSGKVEFAHVHMSVRYNHQVVDPFRGLTSDAQSCGDGREPLWSEEALAQLQYRRGQVLDIGFASGPLRLNDLETGAALGFIPLPDSPALVAWGWAINLEKGDEVVTVLTGPEGVLSRNKVVLDRAKSQYMLYAGKELKAARWPPGRYAAAFGVRRNGEVVLRAGRPFQMR